jgi:hypothetical protein
MLELSLAAACLAVYVESTALIAAVDAVLRLRADLRAAGRTHDATHLPLGTSLPSFEARVLGSSQRLTERDFAGHSTILLFMGVTDARTAPAAMLGVITSMWSKVDGGVNIVCRGTEEECLQLALGWRLDMAGQSQIRVLLDDEGDIGEWLGVTRTPSALLIDRDGRIAKKGAALAWPGKSANGFISRVTGDARD